MVRSWPLIRLLADKLPPSEHFPFSTNPDLTSEPTRLDGEHSVPSDPIGVAPLVPEALGAKLELESRLKAPAKVLVEEPVDDGVDAAVEEGQPVS